ncbi:MAG: TRAP transporter substrate-binding protein [Burkholderiaceae bacterium]|jgi:tripartite ATP-independent transporter DctP family solute receptor|nr:TRAP transporter substrate-binding protein [Burkholderiales bacterium]MCZ8105189.1 TRAP transporter substrate-binding protein [Burkholderiales bacterium]MCZ8338882.1 TRAP transporter substrate-binding protein [Burkholderiaceae bacterium]
MDRRQATRLIGGSVAAGTAVLHAPAFAQGRKLTVNVASVYPPDSPTDVALSKLKELAAQRSNGRIEVSIQKSGTMGDERQTFEMLSQGSVEMGAVGVGDISAFFPRYFLSEIPYMFSSQDDFWKFWRGPGRELSAMIEKERAVRTDGVMYRGARYLTSSTAVRSVADVKGLKMRLPPVKAWHKVWESLGALPATIAFGETYMALKTGVVAAQENPPETILAYKFFEAQKFLMQTEHVHGASRLLSSGRWWATLSKDDQALLTKAIEESVELANGMTRDGDAPIVKKLQELGMTLVQVDKNAFREAVRPAVEAMAKSDFDPGFYEKVRATLR